MFRLVEVLETDLREIRGLDFLDLRFTEPHFILFLSLFDRYPPLYRLLVCLLDICIFYSYRIKFYKNEHI